MKIKNLTLTLLALYGSSLIPAHALTLEKIKFGDMQNWVKREITESKVLGGNKKTVWEIAPTSTIIGNKPYYNAGGSPWATSNVYAKVSGIVKASNSVSPATVNGQKMACLQALMEHVKVLGVIDMDVMVAGSIFLGKMHEPISSTKAPFAKMEMGIPYTKRPKALVYDMKLEMPGTNTRVKSSGLGAKKTLSGRDQAEVYVLLQRRWEDSKGNLYAHRVGTGRERFNKSMPYQKGRQLKINYGDISKQPYYKSYMGLLDGSRAYYAKNSKGKMVPVHEVGWDSADAKPTHVLVMASSSCGEPFVGTEGIKLYVDNFAFGF